MQIEKGTTATTYEPYKESITYIQLTQGMEMNSLPNGVKDEVCEEKGKYYLDKRTNKKILQSNDITYLDTSNANVDLVHIKKPMDFYGYSTAVGIENNDRYKFEGYNNGNFNNTHVNDVININKISGAMGLTVFVLAVEKNKYVSLVDAQNALAETSVIYQLA